MMNRAVDYTPIVSNSRQQKYFVNSIHTNISGRQEVDKQREAVFMR